MADKAKGPATSGQVRGPQNVSVKVMAMKYTMPRPSTSVYPLDEKLAKKTYPDYSPWEDNSESNEKLENSNCLKKGFFETSKVSNEYYSARNLIQETVFSSSLNCNSLLKELSQHLIKSYKTRDDSINKIRSSSFNFRLPSRVTLTATKKEAWLRDLADPEVPLSKVSSKIPHGLRNKVLVDAMCSRSVPLPRAIWFTKCSLLSEFVSIRKKVQTKHNSHVQSVQNLSNDSLERRWLQEWTQQIADYILKFSKELSNLTAPDLKSRLQERMHYLISYVSALYIEDLLDKPFLLSLIVRLLKEEHSFGQLSLFELNELAIIDMEEDPEKLAKIMKGRNFDSSQTLMGLLFVKIFWVDFMAESFLCKHLSEALLLNYFVLSRVPSGAQALAAYNLTITPQIKDDCLVLLSDMLTDIFRSSPSCFVLPTSWFIFGEVLHSVIRKSELYTVENQSAIEHTLVLMDFRNESLMINTTGDASNRLADVSNEAQKQTVPICSVNRTGDDIFRLIDQLDNHKFKVAFESLIYPASAKSSAMETNRRLRTIIFWCVSSFREMGFSKENLLIVCNAIKGMVSQGTGKTSLNLRNQVENAILECIFHIAEIPPSEICQENLYVLINELYQLKVITISAYLRKLIASGVFFSSPGSDAGSGFNHLDSQSRFHLSLLQNLPVLNNRQCDHILRKWTGSEVRFAEVFEHTTNLLRASILSKIMTNTLDESSGTQHLDRLNVGLKFLVMNWFVSELKTAISKSSKLIHVTPLVIAKIYSLLAKADNLNLFFKGFLTFVLKNENGVIIFYMDSLYFMSRLILRHSELLSSITGISSESLSASYNLQKLIVQNYKDLSSRESDMFDFRPYWKHIDRISRSHPIHEAHTPKAMGYSGRIHDQGLAMDTDKPVNDSGNFYLSNENVMHREVENLMNAPTPQLTDGEVEELEIDLARWIPGFKEAMRTENLQEKMTYLLGTIGTSEEDQVLFMSYKLLANLKRKIDSTDMNGFTTTFYRFIEEDSISPRHPESIVRVCKFSLAFQLLSCETIATYAEAHQEVPYLKEMRDDILGTDESSSDSVGCISILYDIACHNYRSSSRKAVLASISRSLHQHGEDLWRERETLYKWLRINPTTTTRLMLDKISKVETMNLLSGAMGVFPEVTSVTDIHRLVPLVNEFNLPIAQVMLPMLIDEAGQIEEVLETILRGIHFYLDTSNTFFGELFCRCQEDVKLAIFERMEFLFLQDSLLSDTGAVSHARPTIPMFRDYFMKLNDSFVEKIKTSPDQIERLVAFLRRFLKLAEEGGEDVQLRDILSVFLRILVIRNASFTDMIMGADSEHNVLVSLLVSLSRSKFMDGNQESLKILLYDLLLLIKNSVTSRITLRSDEEDNFAVSPLSHSTTERHLPNERPEISTKSTRPNASALATISAMADLEEPFLHSFEAASTAECALSLSPSELQVESDVKMLNHKSLFIASKREAPFGEIHRSDDVVLPFSIRSIQLIENTGKGVNDGCINLSLLKAYTTKENEP